MWKIYKTVIFSFLFTAILLAGVSPEVTTSKQKAQEMINLSKSVLAEVQAGGISGYKLDALKSGEALEQVRITPLAKTSAPQNTTTQTLVEDWDGGVWVNDALYTDTNGDGGLIFETFAQEWNGSSWVNDWRGTFSYTNVDLTEMINQEWNGSTWVNTMKFIWNYDAHGNNTEQIIQTWESNAWVNMSKSIDTFDGNNYLTSSLDQMWNTDSNAWEDLFLTTYTNNGNGDPTEALEQMWMGTWMDWSKTLYTYNASNLLIEEIEQSWDMISSWINSGRILYSYDGSEREIEIINQDWAGAWVNSTRRAYTYSGDLMTESLLQEWDGAQWVNMRLTTYTHDGQDRVTVMLEQDWQTSAWVNSSRWTTTYGATALEDFDKNLPINIRLSQNYPNPFNPSTVISYQLSGISDVNLSIFNILGQKVATLIMEEQEAGTYKVEWDASEFTSGVYFYKLTVGNVVQIKKMMLTR